MRVHIKRISTKGRRYLSASPLPVATGLFSVSSAFALSLWGIRLLGQGHPVECLCLFVMALGWAGLSGFAFADSLSRYRESLRMGMMFSRFGVRTRILRLAAGSRCQRDAAVAAARRIGRESQARGYFRSLGYRWYHLLPDKVAENPLVFFSPAFLLTGFFSKRLRKKGTSTSGQEKDRNTAGGVRGSGLCPEDGAGGR